jgi:Fe-S-cluster containining protein
MTDELLTTLADLARQYQAEFDADLTAWRAAAGANVKLWCGPECGNCCTLAVNATFPEALAIHSTLDTNQRAMLANTMGKIIVHARQSGDARAFLAGYRQAVGPCPFLTTDSDCGIYMVRPLACRALLATRPPEWCGVNLGQLPSYERDAFLASLDRRVVAFPTHYAAAPQELAAAGERALLAAMQDSAGFSLSGNLPLLTMLCGATDFAPAVAAGPVKLPAFLATYGIDRPFLLQINHP